MKTLTADTAQKLVAYMEDNGIGPSDLPAAQHIIKQRFVELATHY